MKTVKIPGWSTPAINAARWLRQQRNIPEYEIIEDVFSEYFNCRIIVDSDGKTYAEFDEKEALLFMLRWL